MNGKDAPERSGAATHFDSVGEPGVGAALAEDQRRGVSASHPESRAGGSGCNPAAHVAGLCWAIGPSCMSATKHVHDSCKATGRRRGSVPLDAAIAAFRKELGPTD